eukprot:11727037-Heterocapsa_arctica.AAC.1
MFSIWSTPPRSMASDVALVASWPYFEKLLLGRTPPDWSTPPRSVASGVALVASWLYLEKSSM